MWKKDANNCLLMWECEQPTHFFPLSFSYTVYTHMHNISAQSHFSDKIQECDIEQSDKLQMNAVLKYLLSQWMLDCVLFAAADLMRREVWYDTNWWEKTLLWSFQGNVTQPWACSCQHFCPANCYIHSPVVFQMWWISQTHTAIHFT